GSALSERPATPATCASFGHCEEATAAAIATPIATRNAITGDAVRYRGQRQHPAERHTLSGRRLGMPVLCGRACMLYECKPFRSAHRLQGPLVCHSQRLSVMTKESF